MSGWYSTNPTIRSVPRAGSILPIRPAHNHRIAFRNHLLGFRKKIKMLFTSQGRSVLGKTVPSVLCTAQDLDLSPTWHQQATLCNERKTVKMVTFELFWAFSELFFVRVYWEIPVLIITFWTQFFITIKHLAVFWRSYLNTETLEIFLLLKHFSCWLSAPYFGKLYGSRQIQDIHSMKELFCKIFVLNISVFCTFSFFCWHCSLHEIHWNLYRDSCDTGFRVQFNAEFTRQEMNFPIELY